MKVTPYNIYPFISYKKNKQTLIKNLSKTSLTSIRKNRKNVNFNRKKNHKKKLKTHEKKYS